MTILDSEQSNGDELDTKIAQLLIENPSTTDETIAQAVGLSRQTVNRRRRSDNVQRIVRNTLKLPEDELRRLTAKALMRLEKLIDCDDPRISFTASVALLKLGANYFTAESDIFKYF